MMKKILIILVIAVLLLLGLGAAVFFPFATVTKGPAITAYSASKTALLVIDIQKDMTERNGKKPLNLDQTDSMIPVVNKLIKNANEKNWLVVYITHEYKKNSILRLVTRDFLLEGMPGAKMDSRILVVNQNHFTKYYMDTFSDLKFEDFLRENQINHLLITGIAAEQCIDKTCQAALNRGYKVTVISDGIAGSSESSRKRKISDYKRYGAQIIEAEELIKTE